MLRHPCRSRLVFTAPLCPLVNSGTLMTLLINQIMRAKADCAHSHFIDPTDPGPGLWPPDD